MIDKIKKFYQNNRVWLYILRYVLISIGLSAVAIAIDTRFVVFLDYIPSIFLTSIDLAKVILSTLAGALLTITTFTFSTIMVVLTMYSSNFSPRVVNNFLTDKVSMKVLGVFVGGFFYSIITLFFMRNSFSESLVVSATIGVIYAIFSIIYFVLFIYRVSSSIQASKLIKRVYDESYEVIEDSLDYKEKQENLSDYNINNYSYKKNVYSDENGYLQLMNLDSLGREIKEIDCKIIINPHIGDFISVGQDIGTIHYNSEELDEGLADKIKKTLTLGNERLAFNDYRFSLQKIVDIALRAISPGINDPNTAIHCINILGVLLGKLSEIDDDYTIIKEEDCEGVIIYEDFNFREDLYFTLYQLVHYGKKDISIITSLLQTVNRISNTASEKNLKILKDFSDYIYDNSINNFTHNFDLDLIKKARYSTDV